MHGGFRELRNNYVTDFVGRYEGEVPVSEKARAEVERLLVIWGGLRKRTIEVLGEGEDGEDGGWLCGEFGVVDAFFWPVLWVRIPSSFMSPHAISSSKLGWLM